MVYYFTVVQSTIGHFFKWLPKPNYGDTVYFLYIINYKCGTTNKLTDLVWEPNYSNFQIGLIDIKI